MSGSKKSGLFLLVLLAMSLIASSIPNVQADSDTWQIGAGSDDCYTIASIIKLTESYIYLAHTSFAGIAQGFRFTGIEIAQGSTISSACLSVYGRDAGDPGNIIIKGDDADNASTFSTRGDYDNRLRTDSSVTWDAGNIPASTWVNTSDISSVIQEIINRVGWESGNALAILSYEDDSGPNSPYVWSYEGNSASATKLHVTWTPPPEDFIDNSGIEASDITPDDKQWFFLNASIEVQLNTSTFLFNRIDIDPTGLNLSCSYTNSTNTFVEENDPNNYLQLDTITSTKTDINSTNLRIDYYLRFHHNVTKDGAYDVKVYSTASGGLNDTDTFNNVFTLTIREPLSPTELFGSGFNATSPYVELHWNHSLVNAQFFEIQNSTDAESWTYLGQSTTANYTDTQVVNGTKRHYKVRACFQMDTVWSNSSWSDMNFEKVYFIPGVAPPVDDYSIIFLAIGLIMMLSVAFLYVKDK